MRAGTLRHRIGVVAFTENGRDAHGAPQTQWVTQKTVAGSVKPIAGREYFNAQAVQSDVTHEIRLRHYEGLTAAYRLTHDARTFQIKAVINIEERNRETVCMCTEVT